MKRIKPQYWFFISWILITGLSGIWSHFNSGPNGMHQGAQSDRASVAWNYYAKNMNFFEPRVMENRTADGVAGMEFPILNYSAAMLYKAFGPKEWLYRALMFAIVSMGMFAAFLITGFFIQKTLSRLLLIYGWFLSPIFLFYANNFVPDPAAMAFSMIAMYFFFRFYFQIQQRNSLFAYLIFITLAGLIKITFLIPHIGIAAIFILYYFKPAVFPSGLPRLKFALLWFIAPFIPVFGWYYYASWLTQKTGNLHFLQQINPAKTLPDFIENTRYGFNTWQDSIYAPNLLYIILILFFVSLFNRWKSSPLIAIIASLFTLGFIGVLVLFNFQFRYHDYYYFLLFPALFFMLLFLQQVYLEGQRFFMGLFPILVIIGFYYLPFGNFFHAQKMLTARYTPGNYYHQLAYPEARFYDSIRFVTDKLLPKGAEVYSAFDPSPNTSLYLMRHCGIRIAPDFKPEMVKDWFDKKGPEYLVINDSLKWENFYEPTVHSNKKLIYRKNLLSIYRLEKTNSKDSLIQK